MQGKVAIVTAGVAGMGRRVRERWARHGAKVSVTDPIAAAAQGITEALRAADDQTIAVDAPGILFDPDAA
jgi:NAD(P)-dependent dehydrogenase (short-subunit alcohol dehydrogenase family)